jgi:hypothetical protein
MQCCAKSKRSQQRCRRHATPGMMVCRFHGGKTPRGPALPQFRTGKYSKLLPARLVARYRTAARDPELLSLHSEIALVDARINDLLTRVDTGESRALWRAERQAHRAFKAAREVSDVRAMHEALAQLEGHLEGAVQDDEAWQAIGALIEQRRKLVGSEQKRLITLQQMITAESAMLLIGLVVDIIARHITDREILASIVGDLQQLLETRQERGKDAPDKS